jgi:hypothetical protein
VADGYVVTATGQAEGISTAGCPGYQPGTLCQPWVTAATAAFDTGLHPIAVADGILYSAALVNSNGGYLYAFDIAACAAASTPCQPLWTAGDGTVGESVSVANGVVYVGGRTGCRSGTCPPAAFLLQAFSAAGCATSPCARLWRSSVAVESRPVVLDGVVYTDGPFGPTTFALPSA